MRPHADGMTRGNPERCRRRDACISQGFPLSYHRRVVATNFTTSKVFRCIYIIPEAVSLVKDSLVSFIVSTTAFANVPKRKNGVPIVWIILRRMEAQHKLQGLPIYIYSADNDTRMGARVLQNKVGVRKRCADVFRIFLICPIMAVTMLNPFFCDYHFIRRYVGCYAFVNPPVNLTDIPHDSTSRLFGI